MRRAESEQVVIINVISRMIGDDSPFPVWKARAVEWSTSNLGYIWVHNYSQCTMEKQNGAPIFNVKEQDMGRRNSLACRIIAQAIRQIDVPLIETTF